MCPTYSRPLIVVQVAFQVAPSYGYMQMYIKYTYSYSEMYIKYK